MYVDIHSFRGILQKAVSPSADAEQLQPFTISIRQYEHSFQATDIVQCKCRLYAVSTVSANDEESSNNEAFEYGETGRPCR